MSGRGHAERIVEQLRAGLDRAFDDGDVVGFTEAQSERIELFLFGHGESCWFKGGEGIVNPTPVYRQFTPPGNVGHKKERRKRPTT